MPHAIFEEDPIAQLLTGSNAMKKSGLIIYSLVLLLAGALIGGGVAFSYVQRITVGGTHYGTNFLEKSGIITIYDGKKFSNVRTTTGGICIAFDVDSN